MKRLLIVFILLAGVGIRVHAQADVAISDQQFYDELNPYGTWVNYPQYGYVWEPNLDNRLAFTPYSTNGRWVYTDEGWTWVSNYPWGWAPFHYGRWFYDDYMGWLWIPGYEWAPAWVTWGSYGGNYGWAPLGPGISISVGVGWRPPRSNWWTFVPCNHFGEDRWHNYIVRNNTTIINHVSIIRNVYQGGGRGGQWNSGPKREEVEHYGNRRIQPMTFNNVQRPGTARVQDNRIALYRPAVNRGPQGAPAKPSRIEPIERVRPANRLPANHTNNPAPGNRPGNNPGSRPNNNPGNRPVNPGNSHNNRPVNPNPASRPANNPSNPAPRPVTPRPGNPTPERPMNRPANTPPVMPHNRPVNPKPAHPPVQRTAPPQRPPQRPPQQKPPQQRPPQQQQRPNPPEHHREG
jgi:hypothetical protein